MNPPGFGEERIQRHGHCYAMLPAFGAGEHVPGFSVEEAVRETLLPSRGAHGLGDFLRTIRTHYDKGGRPWHFVSNA